MSDWLPTNPVERRLVKAHDDWDSFARSSDSALLYWSSSDEDSALIETFLQTQQSLTSAFMRLSSPFALSKDFGFALASEIVDFYDAHREGSIAGGIDANWRAPAIGRLAGHEYMLAVMQSLMKAHPDIFPAMVIVLEPSGVADTKAFERWLDMLLSAFLVVRAASAPVRFVIHGTDIAPLPWLTARRPADVKIVRGVYHMQSISRELIADSGERGPSGQFRRVLVELSETLSRNDPGRFKLLEKTALDIAGKENWFDQAVVVHLIAGATWLRWNDPVAALASYRMGTQAAMHAVETGHQSGRKLAVNALFGEASVHLMGNQHRQAANSYAQAAALAEADKDGLLAVEAWRMHAYCLDKLRRDDDALESDFRALNAGMLIAEPLRANSNLQMVVQSLMKRVGVFHFRRGELNRRLAAVFGDQWPDAIVPLAPEELVRRISADTDSTRGQI
jgi:hypothetical protein